MSTKSLRSWIWTLELVPQLHLTFVIFIQHIFIAGPLCNQPINCKCATNVECLDEDKCGPCPPGFTGNGFDCEKVRPCELNPCHPGKIPTYLSKF